MSPEALYRAIKEMETPSSGVASAERRVVFTLLYRQNKEHNDRARRFAKKLEGHRNLMGYKQRAVNKIRKSACIKKNEPKCLVFVWVAIMGFITTLKSSLCLLPSTKCDSEAVARH
jgi:hypothetical protein